jgi:protein associated with RNAse G/E
MQHQDIAWDVIDIKSFKHDGSVHRVWTDNWVLPQECMLHTHVEQQLSVVVHAGGRQPKQKEGQTFWTNRTPSVTFFIPKMWYNIVALMEKNGVRYYCNVASPFMRYGQTITYIDYDYDVIKYPDGSYYVIDQEDYYAHRKLYQYSREVDHKVKLGLTHLMSRIAQNATPFHDACVLRYYDLWRMARTKWNAL